MHDGNYAEVDLEHGGTLRMRWLADPETGAARYWLAASNAKGSVVLVPALYQQDPTRHSRPTHDLHIFARLDGPGVPGRGERALRVYGIELGGRYSVDTRRPHALTPRRRSGDGQVTPLPRGSERLARAILGATAAHWARREDRPVLERLAVRNAAPYFLDHYARLLRSQREEQARAARAVTDTEARIAELRLTVAPPA
ncbi:hypothetical protein [Streptomyces venezuelae]|uniref:hypothetical protein n=1 Tax=Streptomyces venezuelae TaxID=54571 RepID=UPI003441D541